MRGYAHGDGCLMQFLQQALDDPDPQPCGRCSVCTGTLPAPGARASGDVVEAARGSFRGQDVVVEPRKMWPSGLPDRKGKIRFLAGTRLALRRRSGLGRRAGSAESARWACSAVDHGWARGRAASLVAELGVADWANPFGGRSPSATIMDLERWSSRCSNRWSPSSRLVSFRL